MFDIELFHHLDEPFGPDSVASSERIGVPFRIDRQARIRVDDSHQGLIDDTLVDELQHWDVEALHEHVGAVWAVTNSADIDQMARAGE